TTTPTPSTPQYQFARPTLAFEPMQPSFSAAPALPYSPASAWIPASVTTTIDPASYLTNGPEMPESTPELAPTYLDTTSSNCNCCCPDPLWCHRSGVFADMLYLRPGNIDYVYAVEQTGPLPTDSPTGPLGRVGFDAAMGYRLGA